jgi:hypothetical protein
MSRLFLKISEFFIRGAGSMTYTASQIAEKMGIAVYTLHYYDIFLVISFLIFSSMFLANSKKS